MTGKTFGRLTVLEQADDRIKPNGRHEAQWLCKCSCEANKIVVKQGGLLKNGHVKSCGCLSRECIVNYNKENKRKVNSYKLDGEYGIGYASNTGNEFYFDLEDFDKIKDYCWNEHILSNGYHSLETRIPGSNETIRMHQIIVGKWSDHNDRNPLNNRKYNLRKASYAENSQNHSKRKDNTSGITGVTFNKRMNKWQVCININKKRTHLGSFINKEDAIITRLKAESKYYGEYAPQRHLFEKYGIKIDNEEDINE